MKKNDKRSIIAGLYGNALEWYDFLLYASFAPLFSKLFFDSTSSFVSLLATFGVFAIGFLMRPLGGAILGYIADKNGRRIALILSVSLMTSSTFLIAFIPSSAQVGFVAPILFTFLRLIQGIAVGGELPGSATYIIEHMFEGRRGLAGSLVLSTAFLGIFFGSLVSSILSIIFPYAFLLEWGWRGAYLLGGLLGVYGIYLRYLSVESPSFLSQNKSTSKKYTSLVAENKKSLVLSIVFTSILAMSNYVLIAYVTTFLIHHMKYDYDDALMINFMALFTLTFLIPFMGHLSDKVGRKPVFIIGLVCNLLFVFPLFYLLSSGNWYLALIGQLTYAVILSPINATVPTINAELFQTDFRASGSSIGYNLGQALFGGTLPLVALALTQWSDNLFAPAWYLFLWCILVLMFVGYLQESYKMSLK